jgi:hypothetical protein
MHEFLHAVVQCAVQEVSLEQTLSHGLDRREYLHIDHTPQADHAA